MSYSQKWVFDGFANPKKAEIPDHHVRFYKYRNRFLVTSGGKKIFVSFLLAVYIGKKDVMFELFHSGVEENYGVVWTPLSPTTFFNSFKLADGGWWFGRSWTHSWTESAEVILKDDHVFIKFDMDFIIKTVYSINLQTISSTLPAFLVSETGRFLVHMEKYPGIKSLNAAETVWNAFDEFNSSEWRIQDRYFEKQRDELLELLKKGQDKLVCLENELQQVCDEAADALNTLSQKYGIEVSL